MMNTGNNFYLIIQDTTSMNFQSYYLTTADCTSRDANRVCQACATGLVRNNLLPDNNCVPASDYTGYVADTVNLLLSLCPGNPAAPIGRRLHSGRLLWSWHHHCLHYLQRDRQLLPVQRRLLQPSRDPQWLRDRHYRQPNPTSMCRSKLLTLRGRTTAQCTACDQANGYILVGSSCKLHPSTSAPTLTKLSF